MIVTQKKYKNNIGDKNIRITTKKLKREHSNTDKKKIQFMEKIKIIFGVIVMGVLCIGILLGYVQLTESRYHVNTLHKEVKQLQAQVENLQIEVEGMKRSDCIEQKAKEKLGMQYPVKEQMVFLNIDENEMKEMAISNKKTFPDIKKDNGKMNGIKVFMKKFCALMD